MAIINPWIFYLIEVLNGLKEVSVVVIFMTIIMLNYERVHSYSF